MGSSAPGQVPSSIADALLRLWSRSVLGLGMTKGPASKMEDGCDPMKYYPMDLLIYSNLNYTCLSLICKTWTGPKEASAA